MERPAQTGFQPPFRPLRLPFSFPAALCTPALPPDGSGNRTLRFANQLRRRVCFPYLRELLIIVGLTWLPVLLPRKQTAHSESEQYWKLLQKGEVLLIEAWLAAGWLALRGLEVISDSWESISSQNGFTEQEQTTDWTENHSFLNWNRFTWQSGVENVPEYRFSEY